MTTPLATIATSLIAHIRALPDCLVSGYQPDGKGAHSYAAWCESEIAAMGDRDLSWAIAGLALCHAECHDTAALVGNVA